MARQRGFTLIELLIVMVVIAILAAIAVSSYKEQIRKSRRTEAYNYVAQMQLSLERWRAENASYANSSPASANYPSAPTTSTYYTIVLSGAAASAYTITATPKSNTAQYGDRCGVLTLTCDGTLSPPKPCTSAKPTWATSSCN
jgi:type IV pilus assembly protein PilE